MAAPTVEEGLSGLLAEGGPGSEKAGGLMAEGTAAVRGGDDTREDQLIVFGPAVDADGDLTAAVDGG